MTTLPDSSDPTPAHGMRVAAGFLAVLAILPTLMLPVMLPSILAMVRDGQMAAWQLGVTALAWALLPLAIALLFRRHRLATPAFAAAVVMALVATGSPFGRILAASAIVSLIGLVISVLARRRSTAA